MAPSPPVPGRNIELSSAGEPVRLYTQGEGQPLLLIHSINAAASAAEVLPLYAHYARSRRVYALDLPGFGLSSRSDRAYTPRLMTDAIHEAVACIRRECGVESVDALALSLSCEFLARAAREAPQHFATLALISPTGFSSVDVRDGPPGSTLYKPWLMRVMRGPGWWSALFRGLTKPAVIRYFLRRTWGRREIDEDLWRYAVQAAHALGAEHAPLYFVTGSLFSRDIHAIYDALQLPVWLCHGVRGDFTNYRRTERLRDKPNWRVEVLETGALPQFERLAQVVDGYDAFMNRSRSP